MCCTSIRSSRCNTLPTHLFPSSHSAHRIVHTTKAHTTRWGTTSFWIQHRPIPTTEKQTRKKRQSYASPPSKICKTTQPRGQYTTQPKPTPYPHKRRRKNALAEAENRIRKTRQTRTTKSLDPKSSTSSTYTTKVNILHPPRSIQGTPSPFSPASPPPHVIFGLLIRCFPARATR